MPSRPNILWIVTTQWRGQAAGTAGDPNARTPWLDGIASDGVNFGEAVTPHPMGPQARAALLTGRPSPENGVRGYHDSLPGEARTIADALGGRGYKTGYFGKWHLFERPDNGRHVGEEFARILIPQGRRGGFGFWEGFEGGFLINDPWLHGTRLPEPRHFKGYQADIVCQRAAEWCVDQSKRRLGDGAPWFCVVSLESPHPPYGAPAPHVSAPSPASLVLRPNVPMGGEVEVKARDELAGYYMHIEATDRALGRLVAEVGLDETALVVTSVHGDMHGSHGVFRKAWPWEEAIRVPFIVRLPGKSGEGRAGTRDNSPVSLADLPAMAVAWADGHAWRCHRDHALISMPSPTRIPLQCPDAWHGFRTPRHKLVFRSSAAKGGRAGDPAWLYYDLENDPFEMRNLAEDPSRAGEIAELARWM